ncbi:MAG: hypothetical protein V4526_01750 [Patescibacteria group bacterium]
MTTSSTKVLLIAPKNNTTQLLEQICANEFQCEVTTAEEFTAAEKLLNGNSFNIVVLGDDIPGGDCRKLATSANKTQKNALTISAHGDPAKRSLHCQLGFKKQAGPLMAPELIRAELRAMK